MRRHLAPAALILIATLAVATITGCFETALHLAPAGAAPPKVDQAYCGQWTFALKDDKDQTSTDATATVLNFDGSHYFVEWKEGSQKPQRFNVILVAVKDATFAELTPLGPDLADTHLLIRARLEGTKLNLRQLKKEFFEGVTTDHQLRQKVEQNLNNDAMYEGPWVPGSLTSQP